MAALKEVDHTGLPAQEESAGEQPRRTPERRHVDVLLDLSEEDFMKELEPHEYHCYSGVEEAVRGWARVAPLSCILLTQKRHRKPKPKEADNPTPWPADPTTLPSAGDGSAGVAAHRLEPHTGPRDGSKKPPPPGQQAGSWSGTAAPQTDAPQWPVLGAVQKATPRASLEEKTEEEVEEGGEEEEEEGGTLRETPSQPHRPSSKCYASESRPARPQRHSHRHRPSNTVVPIKNFTFLPPIKSPHPNPKAGGQLCGGKRASEVETLTESCFAFERKSETRGARADPAAGAELPGCSAALASRYRTWQHNPHLFSAVSVSVPRRYPVPATSKPDPLHHRSYSLGRSLTQALHAGAAAAAAAAGGAPAHVHPGCLFS